VAERSQTTSDSAARRLGGHLLLSGMVSLFIGLTLFVIGMFLLYRMSNPAGNKVLTAGKIFVALWLPLVATGALIRVGSPDQSKTLDGTGDR
jgi:hypothetical protein